MTVVGPDGTLHRAGSLRALEHASIRAFVEGCSELFRGKRVLDYGCGKQPYRDIVEAAGGEYVGCDRREFPANVSDEDVGEHDEIWEGYGACLCTQVVQYVPDVSDFMFLLHGIVKEERGHLVLTYPTNWPEVEPEDLHRFTNAGMERLLTEAGFEIVRHESRAAIAPGWGMKHGDREFVSVGYGPGQGPDADFFSLGGGVVARA